MIKLLDISINTEMFSNMNSNSFKKSMKNMLLNKYKEFWMNNIDGKLRTYFSSKDVFQFEQYLNIITNFDKRRSLTKFRISSHRLKIERGRFSKPPTLLENRVR